MLYILKIKGTLKIPDFVQAEEKINEFSAAWQTEIENAYADVEQMYRTYQSEQVLLTAEMKGKREEAIIDKKNLYKLCSKNISDLKENFTRKDRT